MRWITEYLENTTREWEQEKEIREQDERTRIESWDKLTRAEKIDKLKGEKIRLKQLRTTKLSKKQNHQNQIRVQKIISKRRTMMRLPWYNNHQSSLYYNDLN